MLLPIIRSAARERRHCFMRYERTMLLVDTPRAALAEFAYAARTRGFRPVGTCTSTDFLLLECERLRPHLVVMDLAVMGSIHPMIAIQRLKKAFPETLVIATAAPSESAQLMEAMTMGAADFILKPYRPRAITDCLDRLMG